MLQITETDKSQAGEAMQNFDFRTTRETRGGCSWSSISGRVEEISLDSDGKCCEACFSVEPRGRERTLCQENPLTDLSESCFEMAFRFQQHVPT